MTLSTAPKRFVSWWDMLDEVHSKGKLPSKMHAVDELKLLSLRALGYVRGPRRKLEITKDGVLALEERRIV